MTDAIATVALVLLYGGTGVSVVFFEMRRGK